MRNTCIVYSEYILKFHVHHNTCNAHWYPVCYQERNNILSLYFNVLENLTIWDSHLQLAFPLSHIPIYNIL